MTEPVALVGHLEQALAERDKAWKELRDLANCTTLLPTASGPAKMIEQYIHRLEDDVADFSAMKTKLADLLRNL